MRVSYDPDIEAIVAGDQQIEVDEVNEDFVLGSVNSFDAFRDTTADEFDEGLRIDCHSEDGFGTYLFHNAAVLRERRRTTVIEFQHRHPNKYWEGRFGLATLLAAMRDQLAHHVGFEIAEIELEDEWKALTIYVALQSGESIKAATERGAKDLADVYREAVVALSGFAWKAAYDTNERLFCTEILAPLLRRMGFVAVHYTQGAREYGKDFTFSEPTRFGHLRHYGLQAKCGDVRGNVNSDVDEIIGQLDDAFKMPYIDVSAGEERFISTFIVAISGRYTDNAKEKIVKKIPRGLVGSVMFLDRERVLELIEQHWVKN